MTNDQSLLVIGHWSLVIRASDSLIIGHSRSAAAPALRPPAGGFERPLLLVGEAVGAVSRDLGQNLIDLLVEVIVFLLANYAQLSTPAHLPQPREPMRGEEREQRPMPAIKDGAEQGAGQVG